MTEKDLDIAIEKCERIMEFDTRTLKNPESENGWLFDKVYDLLQFLRQLQFAPDTNVATTDTVSRAAVVDAIDGVDWYHQNDSGEMVHGANSAEDQPWYKAEDIYKAIEGVPSAQPMEDARAMCGECDAWNQYKNPQSRWIPCTPDTMPQEDGEYLVTIHWKNGGYYTDLLIYKAYLKEWKNEDKIFGIVIAWQPKPAPYQEKEQNGNQ